MKITVYKCDLCKHLFVPTEEPVLIRGTERDICPSCLDQLVKRFETDETAAVEEPKAEPVKVEPAKVEEEPKPKQESVKQAETKPKKGDEMKTRSLKGDKFFELFDKGLTNAEVTKKLGTGSGNTYYWRKRWEEAHPEKKEKEN